MSLTRVISVNNNDRFHQLQNGVQQREDEAQKMCAKHLMDRAGITALLPYIRDTEGFAQGIAKLKKFQQEGTQTSDEAIQSVLDLLSTNVPPELAKKILGSAEARGEIGCLSDQLKQRNISSEGFHKKTSRVIKQAGSNSRLSPMQERLRRRIREKQRAQCLQSRDAMIEETTKYLSAQLILAEKENCPTNVITDGDITRYQKNEEATKKANSDRAGAELLQERDRELAQQPKPSAPPKQKSSPKQPTPPTSNAKKKNRRRRKKRVSPNVLRVRRAMSMYNRKVLEADRVTKRWEKAGPNEIRRFVDTNANGEKIQKYQRLSNDSLLEQRARHYLLGIKSLLGDPTDRSIYSFPTDRGFGMLGEITIGNHSEVGVVYFGIGENGVIYHQYFEKLTSIEKEKIFSDETIDLDLNSFSVQPVEAKEDSDGEWKSTSLYNIEISEKGVVCFNYPGEDHSIRIFPLRKEKLDTKMFK